jgi:hypothetical protein
MRRQDLLDADLLHRSPNTRSVDRIAIPDDEPRRRVPRPCLAELLRGPRRGRMGGHVQVDDPASVVRAHDEDKQDTERGSRDREEVDRGS